MSAPIATVQGMNGANGKLVTGLDPVIGAEPRKRSDTMMLKWSHAIDLAGDSNVHTAGR